MESLVDVPLDQPIPFGIQRFSVRHQPTSHADCCTTCSPDAGSVLQIFERCAVGVPSDHRKFFELSTDRGSHCNRLADIDGPQRSRRDRRYTIVRYADRSQGESSRGRWETKTENVKGLRPVARELEDSGRPGQVID